MLNKNKPYEQNNYLNFKSSGKGLWKNWFKLLILLYDISTYGPKV